MQDVECHEQSADGEIHLTLPLEASDWLKVRCH